MKYCTKTMVHRKSEFTHKLARVKIGLKTAPLKKPFTTLAIR